MKMQHKSNKEERKTEREQKICNLCIQHSY